MAEDKFEIPKDCKFEILVENEFVYNEESRGSRYPINIRWTFIKDGKELLEDVIPYYRNENRAEISQVKRVPPGIKLALSEGEYVELTVEEASHVQSAEKKHLWWVKLPVMADFLFLSRDGKPVVPIAAVSRVPEENGCSDERIRIYLPPEPSTWKLRIGRPGSIKENYQPTYLQRGALLMQGVPDPPDNVSVGSNGSG